MVNSIMSSPDSNLKRSLKWFIPTFRTSIWCIFAIFFHRKSNIFSMCKVVPLCQSWILAFLLAAKCQWDLSSCKRNIWPIPKLGRWVAKKINRCYICIYLVNEKRVTSFKGHELIKIKQHIEYISRKFASLQVT